MVVLPFSYCYGMSLLHTHLAAGGSVVLNNRFMFPEKVLDELERKQCTGLAGVPATYQILLRKTRLPQREFPSLRWLQQAGGKLPDRFSRELRQARCRRCKLYVMYGQTEATARLSYLPPERLDEKLGSIGKGLPHTRLEVLRPDGTPGPARLRRNGRDRRLRRQHHAGLLERSGRDRPLLPRRQALHRRHGPGGCATDSSSSSSAAATSSRRWAIASAPRKSKR